MEDSSILKKRLKEMLVDNLMLDFSADEIEDDQPLFGPEGLGLDSVDALQVVVGLDKHFGLKIADPEEAKGILANVNSIVEAIEKNSGKSS